MPSVDGQAAQTVGQKSDKKNPFALSRFPNNDYLCGIKTIMKHPGKHCREIRNMLF
jgi:hypothetical protein